MAKQDSITQQEHMEHLALSLLIQAREDGLGGLPLEFVAKKLKTTPPVAKQLLEISVKHGFVKRTSGVYHVTPKCPAL